MGKRTRKGVPQDTTMIQSLKNGQLITTIPKAVANFKRVDKNCMLKWSDAGQNRILLEVV